MMPNTPTAPKTILVTGGSGYIASWIIYYLLQDGHTVRTTVRDLDKKEKYAHLERAAAKMPGKLAFFEADLLKEGSFDTAAQDAEIVIHTASPFFISGIKDAQKQLIEPAKTGTRNVLEAATRAGTVKRVVLTSSVAAVHSDNIDIKKTKNGVFTEEDWNTESSEKHQPYSYSKTVAEREAWKLAGQQNNWELTAINPGFVVGPSLTPRKESTSIQFMSGMLTGEFKMGIPGLYFGFVDVRDVAQAHIKAALNPNAKGRHITVSICMGVKDLAHMLWEKYGKKYPLPKRTLPKPLLYLFGPSQGITWKFIRRNVGIPIELDNSYSKQDLGMTYRPMSETIVDQVDQLREDGLIPA